MARLADEERARQREIGARIAARREELRLTQPRIAESVHVSLRAYQNWEAGHTRIAWPNLEALAEVLRMRPEEILHGADEADRVAVELPTNLQAMMTAVDARLTAIEARQAQTLELLSQLLEGQQRLADHQREIAAAAALNQIADAADDESAQTPRRPGRRAARAAR